MFGAAKLRGFVRLFRWELPFTAAACAIFGQFTALQRVPPLPQMGIGFLSVFLLSAAALILNDYFDLASDQINAPERPLPSGIVTPNEVLGLFGIVTVLGLLCSALLGTIALIVGLAVWAIGLLYNWRYKKVGLLGNLLVASSVGMVFIYGGISVGRPAVPLVWYFALLVMLTNLGEEIAADAMDREGDGYAEVRSLAVIFGKAIALRISAAIFSLVIIISMLPFLLSWLPPIDLLPILCLDSVIISAIVRLLNPADPNGRAYIRWIYLAGLAAVLLLIVRRLVLP